jgi:hypothetical protein
MVVLYGRRSSSKAGGIHHGEEEEGEEVEEDVTGVFGSVEFGQLVCCVTIMRQVPGD